MTKQCTSCGGFCGKVCKRENVAQLKHKLVGTVGDLFDERVISKRELDRDSLVYIAQPQRTWVGLTDEDFQPMVQKAMAYYGYKPEHSTLTSGAGFYALVRAIEVKLKEKNT